MYSTLRFSKSIWTIFVNNIFHFFFSVALGTRVQPNRLPTGATSKSNFDKPRIFLYHWHTIWIILLTCLSRFLNLTKVFLTCLKSTITNRAFFYWPELIMRRIEFDHIHNLYFVIVDSIRPNYTLQRLQINYT